ncbi:hypothetical protein LDB30_06895 [Acidithiobacillus ferrooxidans]|nr:hypothetical protein LDB30_06895 [Acidithiobacillus ferrooxidans]
MKPDYGLYLLESGVRANLEHTFYDFRMFHISIMGNGQYTTIVEIPVDGRRHTLSLDFPREQLNQMLARISPDVRSALQTSLAQGKAGDTIDIEGDGIAFGVTARLGDPQGHDTERFVPLIAQTIF